MPFSNCGGSPHSLDHHVVARQVPPEVIVQVLAAAIDFPASEDLERLAVHDEDARRPVGAVLAAAAERTDIDAFRSAMDRMRPRIAGLPEHLLRLDDLVDLRLRRMRLRIDHVDARGADARDDQVAPLEEGVAGERRQGRRAGVPAEMVKLVALVGHRHRVDDLAVCRRAGLHVDDRERVGLREVRAQQQGVGEVLGRRFHRQFRRSMEGRIRSHGHCCASCLWRHMPTQLLLRIGPGRAAIRFFLDPAVVRRLAEQPNVGFAHKHRHPQGFKTRCNMTCAICAQMGSRQDLNHPSTPGFSKPPAGDSLIPDSLPPRPKERPGCPRGCGSAMEDSPARPRQPGSRLKPRYSWRSSHQRCRRRHHSRRRQPPASGPAWRRTCDAARPPYVVTPDP